MQKLENSKSYSGLKKVSGYLDILICLLTFILAFSKGAFYKSDILFPTFCICVIGVICVSCKLVRNLIDHRTIQGSKYIIVVDVSVMLIGISYFLPVIFKTCASMEYGIFETLRWLCIGIVYYIVRTSDNKNLYINVIMFLGIVVGIFGLDEITLKKLEEIFSFANVHYLTNKETLSSIFQYSNATALCMLVAMNIMQIKLINAKDKKNYLYVAGIAMLQMGVIYTTSRMNIFLMILTTIGVYIYSLKNKMNSKNIYLITLVIAFAFSSISESYLIEKNNFAVWSCILVALSINLFIFYLLNKKVINIWKVCQILEEKLTKKKITVTKNMRLYAIIITSSILLLVLLTPGKWKITARDEQIKDTRDIYDVTFGVNTMTFDVTVTEGTEYELCVFECYKDYNAKYLTCFNNRNTSTNLTFNVSENAYKLSLRLTVSKGSVKINSVRLNDKNKIISYAFLPNNFVNRIMETLTYDQNNQLRKTYYQDALKLWQTSWIIGSGGDGFYARYQEVQTTSYVSSKTHSFPLQLLVETGIIGGTIYLFMTVCMLLIIIRLIKLKSQNAIIYALTMFCLVIESTFDLTFSFGIMQMMYIILLACIVNEYKEVKQYAKDKCTLDNKSWYGYAKNSILFLTLIALIVATAYSGKLYIASMIPTFEINEDEENENAIDLNITAYEKKVQLDKYNTAYLSTLNDLYSSKITMVQKKYISEGNEKKEENANALAHNIINQKNTVDNMLENEYYNKYVIEKVAACYFNHYLSYANIYKENFDTKETAYAFYLAYAMKLTQRLELVGKYNINAYNMRVNLYNMAYQLLETNNKYLNSKVISSVLQALKIKQEEME